MRRYLLSVYQPDGPPPADVDLDRIGRAVAAFTDELKEAGAWVFDGGLAPTSTATVVRERDGDVLLTDGPFAEGKEVLGGITILEAPDLDAALAWARKAARATTLPVEVRPFGGEH